MSETEKAQVAQIRIARGRVKASMSRLESSFDELNTKNEISIRLSRLDGLFKEFERLDSTLSLEESELEEFEERYFNLRAKCNDKLASILYTAVVKGKVALPCDISPPSADDGVALILWYKDEAPSPIYTLDARQGTLEQARQSAVSTLDHRAYFNMINRPAFLQLDPVQEEDAGEYRCRVDFHKARTVNTVITLKVTLRLQLYIIPNTYTPLEENACFAKAENIDSNQKLFLNFKQECSYA
ncbi:ig-like domain-containing protein [Trichonephila clavata]|uniref:Ig-like domain-containing protein n=1 Tax=Trichonephila clavata TaxID=2740835 RepID=A0A8X6KYZ4_TRICU|nr:ig-like domain-containing protein [Trichonephila clavata]